MENNRKRRPALTKCRNEAKQNLAQLDTSATTYSLDQEQLAETLDKCEKQAWKPNHPYIFQLRNPDMIESVQQLLMADRQVIWVSGYGHFDRDISPEVFDWLQNDNIKALFFFLLSKLPTLINEFLFSFK